MDDDAERERPDEPEDYESPTIVVLGSIDELTLGGGGLFNDGIGFGSMP